MAEREIHRMNHMSKLIRECQEAARDQVFCLMRYRCPGTHSICFAGETQLEFLAFGAEGTRNPSLLLHRNGVHLELSLSMADPLNCNRLISASLEDTEYDLQRDREWSWLLRELGEEKTHLVLEMLQDALYQCNLLLLQDAQARVTHLEERRERASIQAQERRKNAPLIQMSAAGVEALATALS